jgi:hypothetical protein
MLHAQWQTKILGLILKKANGLINVIEEEEGPNGKKSSEVCIDVQKESVWYNMIYEKGSYIPT